jgi:alkaline phosphatase D
MKSRIFFFLAFSMLIFISCKKEENNLAYFKSDFNKISQQSIAGSDYWADSLEDWQFANNRIECLVSSENRNIHLLTRHLSAEPGNLEMSVRMGFLNTTISSSNKNWAGFTIGSKEQFNNYDDNTVFGKGINIGICTNGALFIGHPSLNHNNEPLISSLKKAVDLKILVSYHQNKYTIDFSVIDAETNQIVSNISRKNISPNQLTGNLVLVSNFENKLGETVNHTKSVWFQDWEIKGSKVAILTKY